MCLAGSNSPSRTPVRKASHSAYVYSISGLSGRLECLTSTRWCLKATATQLTSALAELVIHCRSESPSPIERTGSPDMSCLTRHLRPYQACISNEAHPPRSEALVVVRPRPAVG